MKLTTDSTLESAKEAIEAVIYQYEPILKPEVLRMHHEERLGYVAIAYRLGVLPHIIEKWLIEEIRHLHDVQHMTYKEISKVINRSPSYVGDLYHGRR